MFKYFELKIFKWLIKPLRFDLRKKHILECGCGAGYGIEVLSKTFHPKKYYAFDLSQGMIQRSVNQAKIHNLSVTIFQGDVTDIPLPSKKFDVAFTFTVLHHEPRWREALLEINRVLKPKGLLIINEINERSLNWFERYAKVYHPKAARFTWKMFRSEVKKAGFVILNEYLFLQDFGFFICQKTSIK
jgi:ubiquinone/menaquinone biosynthesis C-methylase UbiE